MDRKFIIIDEKSLELSIYVKLSQSQEEILESKELRKNIDQIAKNLQVSWDVRVIFPDGKEAKREAYAVISKVIDVASLDKQAHDVETKAINFMSAIGELTLPVFDLKDCPTHEPANEEAEVLAEELAFVKSLKEDSDDMRGALIMPHGVPEPLAFLTDNYWTVSPACLRRMIDAYLKEYDHE